MNRETPIRSSESGTVLVDDTSRRRKRIAIIGAAVIALVAIVLAYMMMGGSEEAAPAAGAQAGGPGGQVPTVTVVVPGRELVSRSIRTTGSLAARVDMPVGVAGEGGMVTSVRVQPGQWVGQGQVLATIDRAVQSQEAAQLAASVQVARADAQLAENELNRAEALVGRGFISKADVDRKRAARDAAAARVRVAQAQLSGSRARIGRLDIRSPSAGLVLERNVEPGQVVSGGTGALFRIAQGGQMELLAQLSEADLASIPVGAPAIVTPVGSAVNFTGRVWQLSPVISETNRQGIARIALSYNEALRPGGFATAEIVAGAQQAPVLPESAIHSDQKGTYVYVINAKNEAERRPVRTGTVTPAGLAVVEGLNGTERVVLRAGGFITAGQKVRPQRQVL
ncbi:MAG: efflux RND transporter periplasmic adaptor subunit [Sphingomonas sp.]|nr:efflux RND transporter periplasmic adaptor subunit [Sphingomonas sp.]